MVLLIYITMETPNVFHFTTTRNAKRTAQAFLMPLVIANISSGTGFRIFIFERAKKIYGKNVVKEDIFYYVYGILHSPDYRTSFANDLKKMLPRIPLLEDVRDFWKFSKAGRQLADLHINYETVPPYNGVHVRSEEHTSELQSRPHLVCRLLL